MEQLLPFSAFGNPLSLLQSLAATAGSLSAGCHPRLPSAAAPQPGTDSRSAARLVHNATVVSRSVLTNIVCRTFFSQLTDRSKPPGESGHDDGNACQHEAGNDQPARHTLLAVTNGKRGFYHRNATVTSHRIAGIG